MKKQPTILVYHPKDAEMYAQVILNHDDIAINTASTVKEAEKYLPETEVILGWKFPTELLNTPAASSVRWFQSTGAGVDDLIADKTIPEDITITRIVDQFGASISEYVFAYLLYIVKDIAKMKSLQEERTWNPFIPGSLAGKRIGVAGLGSIGAEIVRKAKAFDMMVYGLSSSGKHADIVDQHFTERDWEKFVQELDYLVLTLPLTESTYHVMDRELLLSMKSDASLINVGRGALLNEQDLLNVMQNGHLKAAVLDVFENEPLSADHPFYSLPNIHTTPHLSGPSTIEGVGQFFIENLKRYISNQPLNGVVDRRRGY